MFPNRCPLVTKRAGGAGYQPCIVSSMWPLTDTALHLIEEANLISARSYGIELDLEELWRKVAGPNLESDRAAPPEVFERRMHELDNRLRDVLVHAWPNPLDPVVLALRYEAENLRDTLHAQWHAHGIAALTAHGCCPCKSEFGSVKNSNSAAEVTNCHDQEAVDQIRPVLVQREPKMMEQGTGDRERQRTND